MKYIATALAVLFALILALAVVYGIAVVVIGGLT